ncbi:MAG: hypothetical protein WBV39_08165 [Rudaea sp.]
MDMPALDDESAADGNWGGDRPAVRAAAMQARRSGLTNPAPAESRRNDELLTFPIPDSRPQNKKPAAIARDGPPSPVSLFVFAHF